MALKKCKDCGGQISTKAKACPHCGATVPTAASTLQGIGCVMTLFITVPIVLLFMLGMCS